MRILGLEISRSARAPRMQGDGQGDDFFTELARHLNAAAHGEGDIEQSILLGANQRDQFIRYTPIARAVSVISSLVAQMICDGDLSVRDADDRKVENRRTAKIIELLTHSPDDGITPAEIFVEDSMSDYLTDGNALISPVVLPSGVPTMLRRYRPHGAYTTIDDGPLAYRAMRAISRNGVLETIPARDMMHVRWPLMRRGYLGAEQREHFAVAPFVLLAQVVITGILQERYTRGRYTKPLLAQLVANYDSTKSPNLTPDQRREIQAELVKRFSDQSLVSTLDADINSISDAPVAEHVYTGRSYQLQQIASFYGLPLPLLSVPLGQWTRGVNEQVMKMAWRACFNLHLRRFLAPFKTRLLMPGERFLIDPSAFVRGDAAGSAELVKALGGDAQRNPKASDRELRHLVGLPREPDGEIVPTMQPMGDQMPPQESST